MIVMGEGVDEGKGSERRTQVFEISIMIPLKISPDTLSPNDQI